MSAPVYQILILQEGLLPLSPDGRITPLQEHRCTASLVWPAGTRPTRANSVVVDPGFTAKGWRCAVRRLAAIGISPAELRYYFATHRHRDHLPAFPAGTDWPDWQPWRPGLGEGLAGLTLSACPGHDPGLQALRCTTDSGEVWAVGDAILNQAWLLDWSYYWPNGYEADEVVQTWRSVAAILSHAQQIIPGHGPAISVTVRLLDKLLANFEDAPQAANCPDVPRLLRLRRERLVAGVA